MISDDPGVCLFDAAGPGPKGEGGELCSYRPVCGQRTGETPCLGMAECEAAWKALPPDVQARYTTRP